MRKYKTSSQLWAKTKCITCLLEKWGIAVQVFDPRVKDLRLTTSRFGFFFCTVKDLQIESVMNIPPRGILPRHWSIASPLDLMLCKNKNAYPHALIEARFVIFGGFGTTPHDHALSDHFAQLSTRKPKKNHVEKPGAESHALPLPAAPASGPSPPAACPSSATTSGSPDREACRSPRPWIQDPTGF